MATIYMVHSVHGAKVAISEQEAEYDEAHGWERFDPEDEKVSALETVPEYVNTMETKRRGRPPRTPA